MAAMALAYTEILVRLHAGSLRHVHVQQLCQRASQLVCMRHLPASAQPPGLIQRCVQNGNGCMMSVNTAPATGTTLNGVNASSITSITFAPTQSVCTQVPAPLLLSLRHTRVACSQRLAGMTGCIAARPDNLQSPVACTWHVTDGLQGPISSVCSRGLCCLPSGPRQPTQQALPELGHCTYHVITRNK